MLVVLIEILRLKERAILSNKGRKSTLAVALVCISIHVHNTWLYSNNMSSNNYCGFKFTSSLLIR